MKVRFTVVGLLLLLVGCASPAPPAKRQLENVNLPQTAQPAMQVTSTAFKEGQSIPRQYTCDGVNISPPLEWNGVPKSAKTIAIIAADPDAPSGTWVHWVVYNLRAENMGVAKNLPTPESLRTAGMHGKQ